MTSDERAIIEAVPADLADTLAQIAELRDRKSEVERQAKTVNAELDRLERLALESLATSGLDGCRVAGRTWWMQEELRLSVSAEARERVLEAARREGIADEITTVATTTLKAWLKERAKAAGRERGASFAEGTAFAGLVTEYVESKLFSRSVG
jgi:hypothetical protein